MATANLYRYFQKIGGDEKWTPIQAQLSLDEIRPTFVTILATDTLMEKTTPKDVKNKAKYQGPMYFDLDAEDIQDSITNAKILVSKLKDLELTDEDLLIYLSGKKGLHIVVPDVCFMQKPQPTQGLVATYKEMAFELAVETMDFRVYTAGQGRQFRTTYNQRENGNYKVPITSAELAELTPESYQALCKTPRVVNGHAPKWRGRFALLFDRAYQKISKVKPRTSKPVSKDVLKQQLPIFMRLSKGELETDAGFNIIAMQLCLYARELEWTEDQLIKQCEGVITNHASDGSRYNTPYRREAELRRMYWYLEDNPAFEYSVQGIKSCIKKGTPQKVSVPDEGAPWDGPMDPDGASSSEPYDETFGDLEEDGVDFGGVYKGVTAYMAAKGEDGDIPVTNFVFRSVKVMRSIQTNMIISIKADLYVKGRKVDEASFTPATFTGGTSLQNAISNYGGSFSGTDIHARGVFQAMLREIVEDQYIVDTEGINLFKIGRGNSGAKKEYVAWADREGVKCAANFKDDGISVVFQGYPDVRGLYQTDLIGAATFAELLEQPGGAERALTCFKSLVHAHTPEVMGKMLGWAAACYYAPLFHQQYGRFPMLHVYGPAGNGKTDTVRGITRLFYHRADPLETTPNSSTFALQQLVAGSASIPLILDEYKPHTMTGDKLNQVRAVLRDAYNAKEIQRGGGNKNTKDNFNALSTLKMQAPIVFVAEAPETETAIVERSVMVSFKRLAGRQQVDCYKSALEFYKDTGPMSTLGLEIANRVVSMNSAKESLEKFEKSLTLANAKFLPAADDWEKVEAGTMKQEEMRLRTIMRPRPVFSSTVAFFGLQVIKEIFIEIFGEAAYKENFSEVFGEMARACYLGMETMAQATLPEYVKVLSVFSDMTKLPPTDSFALTENVDYNLSELGGKQVLVLAVAQAYRKYRAYMRHTGSAPLYPSEDSFQLAIREIPQYIKMGQGTLKLSAPTSIFDLEELYRAAVTGWKGSFVKIENI